MSQSKMDNDDIIINLDNMSSADTISLDVSTIGAAQSTYSINDDTFVISDNTITISTNSNLWITDTIQTGDINVDWNNIVLEHTVFQDVMPDLKEVERMCEEYPALNKAYENFKTIYKMVEQDYKGKKEAGELDE